MKYTFNKESDVIDAFWQGNEDLFNTLGMEKYADVLRDEWHDFIDMLGKDNHASPEVLSECNKAFFKMYNFLYPETYNL